VASKDSRGILRQECQSRCIRNVVVTPPAVIHRDRVDADATSSTDHPDRPIHPELFEPNVVRGSWLAQHVTAQSGVWHSVVAVATAIVAAVVGLAAVFIGLGLLITHLFAHSQLGHADEHVSVWFALHRSSPWNSLSLDLTRLADVPEIVAVAAGVTIFLLIRRWGRFSMLLAIGLGIELAVFEVSEHVVARPRPHVAHLGLTPPTYSWPSGHTAAVLVLYVGIALLVMAATERLWPRALAWSFAVILTIGVAWSRVYEGEHHLTDVVGGILLGAAAVFAAIAVIRVWGRVASRHAGSQAQDEPSSARHRGVSA
jgi:undecaprenyl-diphosphatase